jgi:hypothetical protein
MDELPVIDTTPPFKSDLPRKSPVISDASLKIAAAVVFFIVINVWIAVIISDQQAVDEAFRKQVQENDAAAWDGVTAEDVRRWSKP